MQTVCVDFEQKTDNAPISIGVSTEGAPEETWFKIDNFRLSRLKGGGETTVITTVNPDDGQLRKKGIFLIDGKIVVTKNGMTYNIAGQRTK
jgi:hypothetical protein